MANNSMFDDSLISRMLNETFQEVPSQSVYPLVELLKENSVSSLSITEYATFWRVNFQTSSIDFPINWDFIQDAKKELATNEIVFISSENDFQFLCKILNSSVVGIYSYDDRRYFFSVPNPNLDLINFLNSKARKIKENNILTIAACENKILKAA